MEYIVTYSSTIQISIDEYMVTHPTFKVNDHTTIGELEKLFKKANGHELIIREIKELTK